MKFAAALLILCLGVSCAAAQTLDELVELDAASLSETAWQDLYGQLRQSSRSLRLASRYAYKSSTNYLQSTLLTALPSAELLLNQRQDLESGLNRANFLLSLRTPNLNAQLGSLRFRFGRGLVSGNGSRAVSDSLFSWRAPASPLGYTALGAGLAYLSGSFRAACFASSQDREARLSGEKISSLAVSRSGLLSSTRETLLAGVLGYSRPNWRTAALLYAQRYDRDFAASGLPRELVAASLYAALNLRAHKVDGEVALLQGEPYGFLAWNYSRKNFAQTISYARNAPLPNLAYASSAALLNPDAGRQEFNCDLRLGLRFHTALQLRYSLNTGSSFSGGQQSRLLASANYQNHGNQLRFTLASFDREIISRIDSTYVVASPRNQRLGLLAKYRFRTCWYQQLDCLYSLVDRQDFRQNTYRFRLALGYDYRNLDLRAGFLSWQSPRSFLVEDDLDPEYYSVCDSDDSALFASASQTFKAWNYSMSVQKSLLHPSDFRLNLRLGVSLL